jgi:hypothetical protein
MLFLDVAVEASLPSKKKEIQIIEVCTALYLSAQF